MVIVRWTQGAAGDLEEIFDYIARDSEHYARYQVERLYESVKPLARFPQIGRCLPEFPHLPYREIIVGNYRLIYRYESRRKTVFIVTVAHGRRQVKKPCR